jgi:polyisoprenoid-binding protein YceI
LRCIVFLALLSLLSFVSQAQNVVTFSIKNAGFNVEGTFGDVEATVQVDSTGNLQNSVYATASVRSINTGIEARDKHLQKPAYFHTERFPDIRLRSTAIQFKGRGIFEAKMEITIKNITKTIHIPIRHEKGLLSTSFTLNRLDFGVGDKSWILGEEVKVMIRYPYR